MPSFSTIRTLIEYISSFRGVEQEFSDAAAQLEQDINNISNNGVSVQALENAEGDYLVTSGRFILIISNIVDKITSPLVHRIEQKFSAELNAKFYASIVTVASVIAKKLPPAFTEALTTLRSDLGEGGELLVAPYLAGESLVVLGTILKDISTAVPVVTAPTAESVTTSQTTAIRGVSVSEQSLIGRADVFGLTVKASVGTISMTDASGNPLPGSDSGTITYDGSLHELSADLSTLLYTAGPAAGTATITVYVTDLNLVAANSTGTINIAITAPSTPPINPPPPTSGFDGDQVSLGIYDPSIVPADLIASGTATVTSGATTFPSFAALSNGNGAAAGINVVDGSLTLSGDQMTFLYPTSEEGEQFASGAFNGYVLTDTTANAPDITAVSLLSTDIAGLTASDLSFGAHTVNVNVSGLTLPTTEAGSIKLMVDFAGQTANVSSLIPHPST